MIGPADLRLKLREEPVSYKRNNITTKDTKITKVNANIKLYSQFFFFVSFVFFVVK